MVRSFGALDDSQLGRSCVFAAWWKSSAQCAGLAIAMLLVPVSGEAVATAVRNEISRQKRGDPGWKI
jgi:hypothetical protein